MKMTCKAAIQAGFKPEACWTSVAMLTARQLTHTFEYLGFGAAALNFASFGFSAVWLFSADPMVPYGRDS